MGCHGTCSHSHSFVALFEIEITSISGEVFVQYLTISLCTIFSSVILDKWHCIICHVIIFCYAYILSYFILFPTRIACFSNLLQLILVSYGKIFSLSLTLCII